jgi:hypothetical protein
MATSVDGLTQGGVKARMSNSIGKEMLKAGDEEEFPRCALAPHATGDVSGQEAMTMNVELQINNTESARGRFVSWAPAPCRVRVTNPSGATSPMVNLRITGSSIAGGGVVVFRRNPTGLAPPRQQSSP